MLDCDYENCDNNLFIDLWAETNIGQWKNCFCNFPNLSTSAFYDSVADFQQAPKSLWSFVPTQYNRMHQYKTTIHLVWVYIGFNSVSRPHPGGFSRK